MAITKQQLCLIQLRKAILSYQEAVSSIEAISKTLDTELNIGDAIHSIGEMEMSSDPLTQEDLDWFIRDCKEDND